MYLSQLLFPFVVRQQIKGTRVASSKLFYVMILVLGMFSVAPLFSQKLQKENIAINHFLDKTKKAKDFLPIVNDAITDYLFRTKRFNLIDRNNLEKVLKEKELVLSGITTADEAKEVADILNANYIVVGDIVEASVRVGSVEISEQEVKKPKETDSRGKVTKWVYTKETVAHMNYIFVVRLSAKFIKTETTEVSQSKESMISMSTNVSRNYGELGLGPLGAFVLSTLLQKQIADKIKLTDSQIKGIQNDLFKQASLSLIVKIVSEIPLKGSIIGIEGTTFLVNLGSNNGLFRKCNLLVYRQSHIGTGGNAIQRKTEVATLIVKKIYEEYSEAKIFSGDPSQIRKSDFVLVIPRQFKAISALPSIFVPGLSQMLNQKYAISASFFIGELFFIGVGLPMVYGAYDTILKADNRLDTTIQKGDIFYNDRGEATSNIGRVESQINFLFDLIGWSLFGIGTLIHIGNVIDAAHPAHQNPILVQNNNNNNKKPFSLASIFYTRSTINEQRYYLGLQLQF